MKKESKTATIGKRRNVPDPGVLSARTLKNVLWETLKGLRTGHLPTNEADSIATQAREILRTTSTQLRISQQAKRPIPTEVIDFSEKG